MKKLVASVGLVALGASGLQTASAQVVGAPDTSKPWSVSATLRGFYDDNVNGIPNDASVSDYGAGSRDSFGYEVSPAVAAGWNLGQTDISLGFLYSFKYFEDKPLGNAEKYDQSFTFNGGIDHAFSERFRASVKDSFVIGQEPDLLRAGNTFTTFQRVPGDNIRNYGSVLAGWDLTRELGLEVGYDNAYYNYDDSGPGSLSAILDRMEQAFHLDGRYMFSPRTTGVVGYQFGMTDYMADEIIGVTPTEVFYSDDRNNYAHYGYVGVDQAFSREFSGSLRAGARYTDYYNDENSDNGVSPYVRASARYMYAPGSRFELGFGYDRTATDLVSVEGDSITQDADTFTVFGTVVHQITPKLFGNLVLQFQNSMLNGGFYDGDSEQMYLAGLQFEYRFNQYFSTHIGYNYDRLEADFNNSTYDRNRVYLGVTARY